MDYVGRYGMSNRQALLVGKRLEEIEHKEPLTPEAVVNDAKTKSSPLHGWFIWDDKKAAVEYRLRQARVLVRKVGILRLDNGTKRKVGAFVNILVSDEEETSRQYVSLVDLEDNEHHRQQALRSLFKRIYSYRDEAAEYEELQSLITWLDKMNGIILDD